jgi:hypothetical protein
MVSLRAFGVICSVASLFNRLRSPGRRSNLQRGVGSNSNFAANLVFRQRLLLVARVKGRLALMVYFFARVGAGGDWPPL